MWNTAQMYRIKRHWMGQRMWCSIVEIVVQRARQRHTYSVRIDSAASFHLQPYLQLCCDDAAFPQRSVWFFLETQGSLFSLLQTSNCRSSCRRPGVLWLEPCGSFFFSMEGKNRFIRRCYAPKWVLGSCWDRCWMLGFVSVELRV